VSIYPSILTSRTKAKTAPRRIHIPKHQPRARRDYNHNRPYSDGEHLQPPPPRNLRWDKADPLISTSLPRNLLKTHLRFACSAATGFCSGVAASFDNASFKVFADSDLELFDSPRSEIDSVSVDVASTESLDILKGGMSEPVKRELMCGPETF